MPALPMRAQELQLPGAGAQDVLCGPPQHTGFHMRAIVSTVRRRPRINATEVFHHGVVPGDQLVCQFTSLVGSDPIAEDTVDIHVRPTR